MDSDSDDTLSPSPLLHASGATTEEDSESDSDSVVGEAERSGPLQSKTEGAVWHALLDSYQLHDDQPLRIPHDLLTDSVMVRKQLLSALLEGSSSSSSRTHLLSSPHTQLLQDVIYLSRSLGHVTSAVTLVGVSLTLLGDSPSSSLQRHVSFRVSQVDHAAYYGFSLDGNGRFLLSDFLVTHNTNVEGLSKAQRAAMMEEGIAINESLRMLKSVFRILGEQNKPLAKGQKPEIVQYRGNMLTELMQDSLGGAAKTLMFVNVGPAASNISESVDSLAYGDLVKNITNEKVSADADMEEQLRFLQVQLRAYEAKFGPL